ncbi:MAG: TolC family protein [Microcoleaceae cyanobacterium]
MNRPPTPKSLLNSPQEPQTNSSWWFRFFGVIFATSASINVAILVLSSQPVLRADAKYSSSSDSMFELDNILQTSSLFSSEQVPQNVPELWPENPNPENIFNPQVLDRQFVWGKKVPTVSDSLNNLFIPSILSKTQEDDTFQKFLEVNGNSLKISGQILSLSISGSGNSQVDYQPSLIVNPRSSLAQSSTQVIRNTEESVKIFQQPTTELETDQRTLPTSDQPKVELMLRDAIILALENNRTIKNQYLERIVQRQDLAVAEDEFVPDFTPRLSIGWNNLERGNRNSVTNNIALSADLVLRVPTGGELNFTWNGQGEQRDGSGFVGTDDILQQNLELTLRQPLLRGAGFNVNKAPIKIARIIETINLLDLKTVLVDQITDTILAYWRLLQAQEQLKIEQNSLEIAQQQVRNTQALIDAGRLPQIDLISFERGVANQEVGVLDAESRLKQRQLDLLEVLDLSDDLNILAAEIPAIEPQALDFAEIQQLALENRPDYIKSKLNVERNQLALMIAENNRLWNIDLNAQVNHDPVSNIIEDQTEFRAGIEFSKTLGDLNIERDFKRRQVDVLQSENDLQEEKQQVDIAVENAIREVNDSFKRVQLAQRVTELAEQELRNEEEKLRLGVENTSSIDLVRFRDDLGRSRNEELNARIEYLNALTNLNQEVGTTLETWEITIEQE